MKRFGFALGLTLIATSAWSLPQFSLRSSAACDTCHVQPAGWENPPLRLRKCSLSCGACHVSPTGGGLRTEAGEFFGRQTIPMVSSHKLSLKLAEYRTDHENPMVRVDDRPVPEPGTAERYAGITPHPTFEVGMDVRMMAHQIRYFDDAFFPMQTDIHVAFRPYNPSELNQGRLTFLVTGGVEGSRTEEFSNMDDRVFLKEWWAMYHDLPKQAYVRAGRFLPAFGWRLDDHTAFIRQGQTFDNQRQVTGIEVGFNPNYTYGHLSVFKNSRAGQSKVEEGGWGAALSAGYRELAWQVGGSLMYEDRDDASDIWAGANWGFNFSKGEHPWKSLSWAPVTYIGELDFRRTDPINGDDEPLGITTLHQLDWFVSDGVILQLRYEWQNYDTSLAGDYRERYTFGAVFHPVQHIELIGQYRINTFPGNFEFRDSVLQLHIWY